jgi:hypothetical protein
MINLFQVAAVLLSPCFTRASPTPDTAHAAAQCRPLCPAPTQHTHLQHGCFYFAL